MRFETTLAAPVDEVWARVASLEGVNDELRPFMRMTSPRGAVLTPEAVPLGERWFRSWILVLGVIPIDYDDLCVVAIDPPHGFHERSSMLSARVWEHKRTLVADGEGTRVIDELAFEPRVALFGPVLRALVPRVFRHRHKRLRRYFS